MKSKQILWTIIILLALTACTPGITPTPPATTASPSATPTLAPLPTVVPPVVISTPVATASPTQIALPDGALIKGQSDDVFLLQAGKRRLIPNMDVFRAFRFREADIRTLSDADVNRFPLDAPLSTLLKGSGEELYLIENGQRRHISNMATLESMGFKPAEITNVPDAFLKTFPEGKEVAAVAQPTTPSPLPTGPYARQAVNVRGGPGTVYPIIGGLKGGDPVNIIARNPASDWYQIRLSNGNEGWVAASLIANASSTGVPIAANVSPPPTLPPAATPVPTPLPGIGPPDTTCTVFPIRGFGKVWTENASAREIVGCPLLTVETGMKFLAQRFEGGVMFWTDANFYDNQGMVWVLFADNGTYARIADTYSQGEAEPTRLSPPEGKLEPRGKMGKAWREGAGVQQRLGWAIASEVSGNGSWLEFERGLMFWIPFGPGADRRIYVLGRWYPYPPGGMRNDWLEFIDTWAR